MINAKNNTNPKKDFLWNAIGLTLNSCNSLFFLIVVRFINGLGVAGIFTYAFALCIFLYTFVIFYNRSFQVSDSKDKFTFNEYLTCRLITSIIGFAATILFAFINQLSTFEIGVIASLAVFRIIEAISDCFYGAIQKKNKLYRTGISLSLKAILGLLVLFIVDYLTNNLILAIIALIAVNLIIFFVYDLRNFHQLHKSRVKLSFTHLKPLFKFCLPIFIFSALAIYLSNCQKYILPYYASDDVQAIYGILIMPATILGLIGSYLINPFIGLFTHYHENKNYKAYIKSAKKILLFLTGIGIAALITSYFIGIPILELVFQLDLSIYQIALILIILASLFYAAALIISNLLTILNENRRQTYIYFISALIATVTSILLIPNSGIFGAVYSFLISSFILIILYVILLQITLHKNKHEK